MSSDFANWSTSVAHIAQVVTAAAIGIGGLWGLLNYQRSKRRDAAKWMHELSNRFQLGAEFDKGKLYFDFQYQDTVEPVYAAMVFGGNDALDKSEHETSIHIDRVLNYVEQLLYLEAEGHIKKKDRDAYFGYWIGLITRPDHGAVRRYCVNFGYDYLAKLTRAHEQEYLILYGSLITGESAHSSLNLDKALRLIGERKIKGQLYDLGEYPGLVLGEGEVQAELYLVVDKSSILKLDEYEEYDRHKKEKSLFWRTTMRVPLNSKVTVDAWIYFYNQSIEDKAQIISGSWKEHIDSNSPTD